MFTSNYRGSPLGTPESGRGTGKLGIQGAGLHQGWRTDTLGHAGWLWARKATLGGQDCPLQPQMVFGLRGGASVTKDRITPDHVSCLLGGSVLFLKSQAWREMHTGCACPAPALPGAAGGPRR